MEYFARKESFQIMMTFKQKEILPGVKLTAVQTSKFKTNFLSMTFLDPLVEDHAAMNALLPFVLRRGTQKYPDMMQVSAALDELYGGAIDPIVRKKGETQCIGFIASFLDDAYIPESSQVLEDGIALMAQFLFEPVLENGAFVSSCLESEKENLMDRISSRVNDKQQYAIYRLLSQMCDGEPYGLYRYGEVDAVRNITSNGLQKQYESLLQNTPIEIYYCGSATFERVESALQSALSGLPIGMRKSLPPTQGKKVDNVRYFTDHMDVLQGKLALGFRIDKPILSAREVSCMMVFNAIFGGSTTSKLFLNVRERLSLCYYASSGIDRHKGVMMVSSGIAFEQYENARDEILAQLEDCKQGQFSQEDLHAAKRFVANQQKTTLDSQNKLEEFWLGQAVSACTFGPEELESAIDGIVAEDVKHIAQQVQLDSVYFLQGKEDTQ